jgi:hypothetical protein
VERATAPSSRLLFYLSAGHSVSSILEIVFLYGKLEIPQLAIGLKPLILFKLVRCVKISNHFNAFDFLCNSSFRDFTNREFRRTLAMLTIELFLLLRGK